MLDRVFPTIMKGRPYRDSKGIIFVDNGNNTHLKQLLKGILSIDVLGPLFWG
jgi:hypothetical protein